MNGHYEGQIKVACVDYQCFPVDPVTLEPLSCGGYDPYALSDPDPEPIETISHSDWCLRRMEIT